MIESFDYQKVLQETITMTLMLCVGTKNGTMSPEDCGGNRRAKLASESLTNLEIK